MPILKSARHEKFAQGLASGMSQQKAYKAAGFSNNAALASRLANTNENIKARVAELASEAAQRFEVTQDSLIAECDRALKWAAAQGDVQGSVACTTLKAKLTGLLVRERDNTRAPIADLADDVVTTELARLRKEREAREAMH